MLAPFRMAADTPDMRQLIRHRQGIIHAISPNNGNTRFLKGAHFASGGGIVGALYNYQENAAQPPSGSIYHSSGANSLKVNVVDANGINHQSGIQNLRAGDKITIGTQSSYLTGTPGITSGVALVLVQSWPNYTNGQYSVTVEKGVLPYATVAPIISGNSLIGSTLTCTPGTWSGSPTPSVTRQWKADGNNIAGQTGLTYVTQAGDAGKHITCVETGTSLTGTGFSASNAIVAATTPVNTVAPVISGGPNVGTLLTTTNGTWTGLPAPTFTYHWFAGGVATPGTDQTYTIRPIDAGKAITCVVTGTNPAGAVNATSNAITAIQPPVNLTAPVVTGEGTPGQTLTCGTGTWNADPAASYTRQWKSDGTDISGQTASTYVVQAGDVGKTITCAVTATNTGGSAVATSNGIFITAAAGQPPVNTVAPVISGTGTVGNILSMTSQGTWTGTPPINYTYQWQRDGANTGNTGNSYVVQAGDDGKTITCRVTGTNVDGVSNASSNGILCSSSFSPASLFASGEQGAWYDPSDLTTMFQDRAGTTPVTADGQTVGLILDKSGRGNNAIAPNDSARPLYKTSGGLHWLQFDGVDDGLLTASIDKSAWAGGIAVVGHLSVSGVGGVLKGMDGEFQANHTPFSNNSWYVAFGGNARLDAIATLNYSTKYVTTRVRNSTNTIARVNGSQVWTASSTLDFGGTSVIAVGQGHISGSPSFLAGNIYSVIIRAAASTTQEITDTETWVNGKTGAY